MKTAKDLIIVKAYVATISIVAIYGAVVASVIYLAERFGF